MMAVIKKLETNNSPGANFERHLRIQELIYFIGFVKLYGLPIIGLLIGRSQCRFQYTRKEQIIYATTRTIAVT